MSAHLFCLKNKGPQVASSGFPKHTYISSGFCTVVLFKQRKPTNRFSSSKDTKKTFTSPRTTFCYVEAGELLFKLSVLKHNGWIFFFFLLWYWYYLSYSCNQESRKPDVSGKSPTMLSGEKKKSRLIFKSSMTFPFSLPLQ